MLRIVSRKTMSRVIFEQFSHTIGSLRCFNICLFHGFVRPLSSPLPLGKGNRGTRTQGTHTHRAGLVQLLWPTATGACAAPGTAHRPSLGNTVVLNQAWLLFFSFIPPPTSTCVIHRGISCTEAGSNVVTLTYLCRTCGWVILFR